MTLLDDRSYGSDDADSTVQDQVLNGLLAAREHERNRPRLPLPARRELIDANFPRVPDGDAAAERPTEEQCARLRFAMLDAASEETSRAIANLREQLAEYHSLLDQLSATAAKCDALEKKCQERGCRVQALEWEVASLKQSIAARDAESGARRRVSMNSAAFRGSGHGASSFVPIQVQSTANSGILQPYNDWPTQIQCHSTSPVCDMTPPPSGLDQRPNMDFSDAAIPAQMQPASNPGMLHPYNTPPIQVQFHSMSPVCDITPTPSGLDERPNMDFSDAASPLEAGQLRDVPSPEAMSSLLREGGIGPHVFFSSSSPRIDCIDGSGQVGGRGNKRSAREFSDGYCHAHSRDAMARYQQRDVKRFKSVQCGHPHR